MSRTVLRGAGGEIPPVYSPVYPDGSWLRLSGGSRGLVFPARAVLESLNYYKSELLHIIKHRLLVITVDRYPVFLAMRFPDKEDRRFF
ncbi:MAG: hypothetical protein ACK5ME_00400 [Parahaliea sp.]